MKTILFSTFILITSLLHAQKAPLKVRVIDFAGKPYPQDKITFVGLTKKDSYSGITNETGTFKIDLPAGQVYEINIQSIGNEIKYNTIDIPSLDAGQYYTENTLTIQYDPGFEFTLSNLHFETAKADIKTLSYSVLNNLAEIMLRKTNMRIEIDGHTDSDGDDQANQTLSLKRAEAVKAYLVSKGVASNRIVSKGFGESRPVASNDTAQGKAQNRRTEIIILR
jgi:outer membrane protein OmpA-like peptidoglycan-associated protein